MSWEKIKLSNCCISIADGDHQPPPKSKDVIPFVTIANIENNQFDFTNAMFVPKDYYEKLDDKRKPQKDDILYSVVGSFGIPVLIKNDKHFVFQRHIAILRPNKSIDARFLYYTMLSRDFYMKADAAAIGAAQRTVSLTALRNIQITVPPIETQHRIANILSAYDDLTENNRKQIKLLEEAAQRLYKEWFVNLRFPGYEHTKITDGVPEGWKIDLLSNIVKTTSGGTPARSHPEYYINGSTLWVKTQELLDAFILDTEEKITDEAITNSSTKLVSKGSILMAMYGSTIGKLGIASQDLTCNQACCVFDVSGFKYGGMYLFCWLFENRKFLIKLGKGVAQSNLSQTMIKNLNILIPDMNVLHQFSCIVDSLYSEILANQKRITILSEARDRLLPKLMSGEVEV